MPITNKSLCCAPQGKFHKITLQVLLISSCILNWLLSDWLQSICCNWNLKCKRFSEIQRDTFYSMRYKGQTMPNKRNVFTAMTHFSWLIIYDSSFMIYFYDSIRFLKIPKVIIIAAKMDLVVLELQSMVKKVAVLGDFTSWTSTHAFLMEVGFKSEPPGRLGP